MLLRLDLTDLQRGDPPSVLPVVEDTGVRGLSPAPAEAGPLAQASTPLLHAPLEVEDLNLGQDQDAGQ